MADIVVVLTNMLDDIINAIPSILIAIIIVIIGILVGILFGKLANILVERFGLERAFDQTDAGKSFRASGMDLSNLVGSIVKFFIIILSIILAIEVLDFGGTTGSYMTSVVAYLPRLLAGVLIIILGVVFAEFLASFISKMIKPMFVAQKVAVADMLKNLLFIGLVAFVLLVALDTMLMPGNTIFPLILGFAIIGVGISMTDALVRSIMDEHGEFREVAGYAKFVLYAIFLIIGTGAIFATFGGITAILANISWALAIALAIMLIPMTYALTKKMAGGIR